MVLLLTDKGCYPVSLESVEQGSWMTRAVVLQSTFVGPAEP